MEFSKYFKSNSNFQMLTAGYEKQKDWEKINILFSTAWKALLSLRPSSATSWDMNANTPLKPKPPTEKEIIIC